MQTSKSKKIEKLLKDYAAHSEVLREMQKQQKEMRQEIINSMRESALSCGDYIAVLSDCTRQTLDKDKLKEDFGQDFINKYTTISEYQKLEVKAA
jgi:predicted phage-related endonuclease